MNKVQHMLLGALDMQTPKTLSEVMEATGVRYESAGLLLTRASEEGWCVKDDRGWTITEAGWKARNSGGDAA